MNGVGAAPGFQFLPVGPGEHPPGTCVPCGHLESFQLRQASGATAIEIVSRLRTARSSPGTLFTLPHDALTKGIGADQS